MQATDNQKIAIIGLGNIGQVVATNLAKNNHAVIVADRNIEKANRMAAHLGSIANPLSIEEAIKEADIIVLSVWFSAIKEVFSQYETLLQGKIIIDPSNPIVPNEKGGFDKIIGADESAGQIIAAASPKGAKLVKALGTLSATSLANAANQQPERVLFYATDDTSINDAVESLIQANGFAAVRVGDLSQSIRIEVFGDLHEFGALGKTVTIKEAKAKI